MFKQCCHSNPLFVDDQITLNALTNQTTWAGLEEKKVCMPLRNFAFTFIHVNRQRALNY